MELVRLSPMLSIIGFPMGIPWVYLAIDAGGVAGGHEPSGR
jgi:hypothetical protein